MNPVILGLAIILTQVSCVAFLSYIAYDYCLHKD